MKRFFFAFLVGQAALPPFTFAVEIDAGSIYSRPAAGLFYRDDNDRGRYAVSLWFEAPAPILAGEGTAADHTRLRSQLLAFCRSDAGRREIKKITEHPGLGKWDYKLVVPKLRWATGSRETGDRVVTYLHYPYTFVDGTCGEELPRVAGVTRN